MQSYFGSTTCTTQWRFKSSQVSGLVLWTRYLVKLQASLALKRDSYRQSNLNWITMAFSTIIPNCGMWIKMSSFIRPGQNDDNPIRWGISAVAGAKSTVLLSLRVWLVPAQSICYSLNGGEYLVGKGHILVASSVFLLLALLALEIWILKEREAHLHAYKQLNFSRKSLWDLGKCKNISGGEGHPCPYLDNQNLFRLSVLISRQWYAHRLIDCSTEGLL